MKDNKWVSQLFDAIDGQDAKGFTSFLASSCVFQFGNLIPVEGIEDIEKFVAAFFESIESLEHELYDTWDTVDGSVCHGQVSYTRKNGTTLTVPFANVLKGGENNITEYLIFADTSALYA